MQTVSAVRLSDLIQPQLLRLLFYPTQHRSLPIEEERNQNGPENRPGPPFLAVVALNLGKCLALCNMSGRSRWPHGRSDAAPAARLLPRRCALDRVSSIAVRAPTHVLTRVGNPASRIVATASAVFVRS